mmetsp:Transcript_55401/g.166081  ORF Transcript_55401/g.166081 Transcript_55401/m.166081 type:complete len:251 (-) Transcript_55401:906-1658(-)
MPTHRIRTLGSAHPPRNTPTGATTLILSSLLLLGRYPVLLLLPRVGLALLLRLALRYQAAEPVGAPQPRRRSHGGQAREFLYTEAPERVRHSREEEGHSGLAEATPEDADDLLALIPAFEIQRDVDHFVADVPQCVVHDLGDEERERHDLEGRFRLEGGEHRARQGGQGHETVHPRRIEQRHEQGQDEELEQAGDSVHEGVELPRPSGPHRVVGHRLLQPRDEANVQYRRQALEGDDLPEERPQDGDAPE